MQDHLQVFAAIVEHSSMNKAASTLNLSQPALSRKIARLEEEIGSPLFRRIGKRLELTGVGRLTYEHAVQLRRLEQDFLQTIAEYRADGRKTLDIGASLTTLQTTLPDLIQKLKEVYPEMDIRAVTGKTHEIVTLVREQKVDFGIVASRIEDANVHAIPLLHDHLQLVLPQDLVYWGQHAPTLADLDGMPMILFSKGTWYRILIDELLAQHQLVPDVKMEIDSFEAILRLLHTCRAAALLPHSYIRPKLLSDNSLVAIPIKELVQTVRTTSLIHLDQTLLSNTGKAAIAELRRHFHA